MPSKRAWKIIFALNQGATRPVQCGLVEIAAQSVLRHGRRSGNAEEARELLLTGEAARDRAPDTRSQSLRVDVH